MIDHIVVKVKSFAKSKAFYEAALKPLGYRVAMEFGEGAGFGESDHPEFWIGAGAGSPVHVAFTAKDRKTVDAFHKSAVAAGGKDNGPPGIRKDYHPNYYGAFVLDLDGNNIEAVCHKPA
jgi:catechol 2,3-dioxygenase-like lactoylglutathione lyase family enzyme